MADRRKKSNYIVYELKKLEKYLQWLQKYLDDNQPDEMVDRIETFEGPRGMPIVKVIAKKEDQIKCWAERLKELPKILLEVNELRKTVDGEKLEVATRGDLDIPEFMKDEDEQKESEEEKPNNKLLPPSSKEKEFDDDVYWEED